MHYPSEIYRRRLPRQSFLLKWVIELGRNHNNQIRYNLPVTIMNV